MTGAKEQEENIVRRLLTTIDKDAAVSQRKLSEEIGIAVGSVNWYLKRCVSKGLVKLQQAPVKRYLYYLTPHGFEEKARLTCSFLQSSLELYRCGRDECDEFFRVCAKTGKKIIFLAGAGDFAEIAILSSLNLGGARPIAVIDGRHQCPSCAGVPIASSLDRATALAGGCPPQAILLTDLNDPKATFHAIRSDLAKRGLSGSLFHVPRILNFRPEVEGDELQHGGKGWTNLGSC
jgi:DNA-binding MarR family transcriptional regulator